MVKSVIDTSILHCKHQKDVYSPSHVLVAIVGTFLLLESFSPDRSAGHHGRKAREFSIASQSNAIYRDESTLSVKSRFILQFDYTVQPSRCFKKSKNGCVHKDEISDIHSLQNVLFYVEKFGEFEVRSQRLIVFNQLILVLTVIEKSFRHICSLDILQKFAITGTVRTNASTSSYLPLLNFITHHGIPRALSIISCLSALLGCTKSR